MIIPVRPGSIVAIVTPMTQNNAIDFPKLEDLLKWHVSEGNHDNYFCSYMQLYVHVHVRI
jgi:dihydrodipicolinate synthase/N-acetylneuraminate lyase